MEKKSPGCKHPINNRRFSGGWYLNTPGYIYIKYGKKSFLWKLLILLKNIKLALYMMYIVNLYGGFYKQLFWGLFSAGLNYWVKISRDLGLFSRFFFSSDLFSSGLFSWDLISWDFIGSPHTILGTWGLEKIRTFFQSFYFQVFFPETFFPGTLLHRFLQSMYNHMVGLAASVVSPFYFILLILTSGSEVHGLYN